MCKRVGVGDLCFIFGLSTWSHPRSLDAALHVMNLLRSSVPEMQHSPGTLGRIHLTRLHEGTGATSAVGTPSAGTTRKTQEQIL